MWIWNLGPGLAVNQSNSSIFTHPLFFGAGGLLEQGHNPTIKQGRQNACDTLLEFNLLFFVSGNLLRQNHRDESNRLQTI